MAIFEGKDYLIRSHFYGSGDQSNEEYAGLYIGSVEALRRTIASTYSKISHSVRFNANNVQVVRDTGITLAVFTFSELESHKIPDHF